MPSRQWGRRNALLITTEGKSVKTFRRVEVVNVQVVNPQRKEILLVSAGKGQQKLHMWCPSWLSCVKQLCWFSRPKKTCFDVKKKGKKTLLICKSQQQVVAFGEKAANSEELRLKRLFIPVSRRERRAASSNSSKGLLRLWECERLSLKCVCVCVCVCERERERETHTHTHKEQRDSRLSFAP